eukprot:CAMPEP_0171594286 /NCGR_PEP_ID=MMETSP0990-20121206/607_1 /TAXON_ID=483369 /ORGANISM="non described non described, Strain CCMP2098" /LENGTH=50 /DNA_ID=CAMNT_0012154963 /DNA_START=73 /DNA_END=228 /DNA_ORIENTATION=-
MSGIENSMLLTTFVVMNRWTGGVRVVVISENFEVHHDLRTKKHYFDRHWK